MKIFVSAYACEPDLGSEIGVGWHWVLEMSKYFELWVLTRESNRKSIEPWIINHPEFEGIHWLYYDLPPWARRWKKGLRGVRIYYNVWQWRTDRMVRRTMQENDIHVFHHLTYGNALWKVSGYGRKQTFIWGPIGGLETIPHEFSGHYGARGRVLEAVRRAAVGMLPLHVTFRQRCRDAGLILCKTADTMNQIPVRHRNKAVLMTDVAVDASPGYKTHSVLENSRTAGKRSIKFLTVGRLDAWRGFDLVIEAFSLLADIRDDVELTVVGSGSDGNRLRKIIDGKSCSDRILMAGQVSREEYTRLLGECDVVVSGALKEGAVTVAFDAIALGKPQVCADTGGYTRLLTPAVSGVVPKGSREQMISGLYYGMSRFCSADERMRAAQVCASLAEKLSWEEKGREIRALFLRRLRSSSLPYTCNTAHRPPD